VQSQEKGESWEAPGSNVMLIKSTDQPARFYKVFLNFVAIFRTTMGRERKLKFEMLGYNSGKNENYYLLGCGAVKSHASALTFRRNVLLQFTASKSSPKQVTARGLIVMHFSKNLIALKRKIFCDLKQYNPVDYLELFEATYCLYLQCQNVSIATRKNKRELDFWSTFFRNVGLCLLEWGLSHRTK
jgi:hypothetical protein